MVNTIRRLMNNPLGLSSGEWLSTDKSIAFADRILKFNTYYIHTYIYTHTHTYIYIL